MTIASPMIPSSSVARLVTLPIALFQRIPISLVSTLARFSLASVFLLSGRTKVVPGTLLTLSDSAVYLFQEEYKLPLLPPELAAHLSLYAEHFLPLLLIIGLGSRFAAFGLLMMTLIIEIFVYPAAYPVHGPWAVCCLVIMIYGAGPLSLDHFIAKKAKMA